MQVLPKAKHGSAEWLRDRWRDEEGRCLFGASDVPVVMGASPYKRRSELFAEKLVEPVVQAESAVFRRGNILEAPLLQEAAHILGRDIWTPDVIYRDGRLSVSLDGVDSTEDPTVVVEAKTTTRYSVHDSSDLPTEWLWQGWAQQAVMQVPVWFVVLDRDLRISCVELPDNEAAIDSLRTEINLFGAWVDERTPPVEELDSFSADDIARIWQVTPTEIELPFDAIDWIGQLDEGRALIKQGEQLESASKDALARLMLNHEIGTFNGSPVITWKQQAGKRSLDTKALRADNPELVAQYEREGNPFRVMRIVKKGNR
jgi:predicted phage-related endonuclease